MLTILFDLDGVLLDTEPLYSQFWQHIGQIYLPQKKDFATSIKGQSLRQIFGEHFAQSLDIQNEIQEELERFESKMDYPFFPEVHSLLQQLRARSLPAAIVTSSNRAKMERVYAQHPDFAVRFEAVFTSEDYARSKPAPDGYLHAAQRLGASPQSCVVIEDSLNGLRAGREAGCFTIGVATSLPTTQLSELAHHVVEDLSEIDLDALTSYFSRENKP